MGSEEKCLTSRGEEKMALICILFPAIVFCFRRNQLIGRKLTFKFENIIYNIFEYLCGNVLINALIIGARFFILHRNDDIILVLNTYSGFSIKYLTIAIVLAVVIPVIENHVKKNVYFSFQFNFKTSRLSNKIKTIIMFFYAFIAAFHNLLRLFDNCFWGDEGIVIRVARQPWGEMLRNVANSGHSPLHYAFAWVCVRILGESGFVYHLSATLPYFIMIFVTVTLVKEWFGNKAAVILISFSTFLNNAVTYNLEVRMYAWCELFILMTYLMTYRLIKTRKNIFYIFMAVTSIGAVYSHYFALASIGILYLVIFVYAVKTEKGAIWKVVVSGGSVLVALVPWLLFTKQIRGGIVADYSLDQVSWLACIDFIFSSKYSMVLLICFFVVLAVAMVYDLGIVVVKKDGEGKKCIDLKLKVGEMHLGSDWVWIVGGLAAVFGTIAAAEIISHLIYPIIVLRYLYVSYVIMWLLFAVAVSKCILSGLWTAVLVAFVLATCYPSCLDTLFTERANNKRLEKTLEATRPEIDENDFIYTDILHFAWTVEEVYYPDVGNSLFGQPEWWGTLELPELTSDVEYWLFLSAPISEDIQDNLRAQDRSADMIVENGYIGTGNVWIYRIPKCR